MEECTNKPLNTPVWKQQQVPYSTYICSAPDCHSNCHSFRFFTPVLRLLRLRCSKCNHSHCYHSRTRHVWAKEFDTQASADEDLKKWEAVKAEKEDIESLIEQYQKERIDLNGAMDNTIDNLSRLVEDYAAYSLSGNFSAHMEKAIRLLEQRYEDMEQKGNSKEQLVKMKESLELMKRKLELVTKAEEKVLKEM
jgi:hypothetical protein